MTSEDFFGRIEQQHKSKLPFVVYKKPNTLAIKVILQQDSELYITKNFSENGFVFAPFNDKEDAVLMPLENSEVLSSSFIIPINEEIHSNKVIESDNEIPAEVYLERSRKAGMTKHINLVQKGIDAIKTNRFQKVVLSRQEFVSLLDNNPISIFKNLLNSYSSAFVYMWYHPKVGLWLGATPETLLKIEGSRFSTMALAGTQQYKGTLDVEWKNKEKEEQQLVTDYIISSLQSSVKEISISKIETIKAGNLLHLKTAIFGTLNFKLLNFKQLLSNLHPTPAVCGFPKGPAKQFILKNEDYNREYYTGFLGKIDSDNSELFVNLRCMQLENNQAVLYVGGGITKDSIPENEWDETLNKTEIIKRALPS
ncbi:MAG: chorismate-binding protein [Flavobacteriaceae bacterium]|nr:chorismate-binding protein [Flavobacteriaceae bacterium]